MRIQSVARWVWLFSVFAVAFRPAVSLAHDEWRVRCVPVHEFDTCLTAGDFRFYSHIGTDFRTIGNQEFESVDGKLIVPETSDFKGQFFSLNGLID